MICQESNQGKLRNMKYRIFALTMVMLYTLAMLVACVSTEQGSKETEGSSLPPSRTMHYITANNAVAGTGKIMNDLLNDYTAKYPDIQYNIENVPRASLLQKLQLLGASNDLPDMFSLDSGKPLEKMIESGLVVDLEGELKNLGIYEELSPTAVELLKSMVGGKGLYALPLEMNIEGIWYNKRLFASYGVEEPQTWGELLLAAETFKQNGVQPFALAAKEKWPITRFINGYVVRKYGIDIMKKVSRGEVSITSPGFIEAARVVQEMSFRGYFGDDPIQVTHGQATETFLNGQAAMYYTGSWALREFNQTGRNVVGPNDIGLFNIPLVEGGSGTLEDWPMNAGLTTSFSVARYDDTMKDWIKFAFSSYGDKAMNDFGMISGFRVKNISEHTPPLTGMVQERMSKVKNGILWFEAFFDAETQSVAWDQAQLLIADPQYSPETYLQDIQKVLLE